jgi:hypothetical protein
MLKRFFRWLFGTKEREAQVPTLEIKPKERGNRVMTTRNGKSVLVDENGNFISFLNK